MYFVSGDKIISNLQPCSNRTKQLSNQAQASSVDGENSLSAEQAWSAQQPRRHNLTPPLLVRAPQTPPRHFSTPPPPASSFEYYTPPVETRLRSSLPLNPWNPFLRSYGRVYPYNVAVNDLDHNYVVMRGNSSPERPAGNYSTRIHLEAQRLTPPLQPPPQPQPEQQTQYCNFAPVHNPLPMGESMRRALARPRSNHSRSFHHYRHGPQDTETNSGYSSLPVELIEISSSDEEDNEESAQRSNTPSSYLRRHSEHIRPTCSRNGSHASMFARSPVHRVRVKYVPNIHTAHMRPTSSEDNISSSANHYRTDAEPLALSLSNNRMKRPHRFSPHSPSKLYRRSHGCCRSDSNHTPENTSPYNSDEFRNGRSRPRVCLNDSNINPIAVASPSQAISNRMSSNNSNEGDNIDIHQHNHHRSNSDAHTCNANNDTDNNNGGSSSSNVEQKEQKFKIRIKREFKIEPSDKSENNENVDSESVVVDTKAHLQPLIANIKQEG